MVVPHVEPLCFQRLYHVPRALERVVQRHTQNELGHLEQALGVFALGDGFDPMVHLPHNRIVKGLAVVVSVLFAVVEFADVEGGDGCGGGGGCG